VKRALISGASGFVGRHFSARLERDGWDVTGFDIADYIARDAVDVFNTTSTRYDLLVHCAANVGGRMKIDGDPLWVAHNLAVDEAAMRWAVRTGTRVLFFSSSAAYPIHLQRRGTNWRLKEHDAYEAEFTDRDVAIDSEADNTYGLAKRVGEYLADKAREHGAQIHVVRPFSGYGPGQSLDYPFPSFIDRALRRADPFDVWGDGTQTRDFVHIDDIVQACLNIIEADYQAPVNLCTGVATSFLELAAACAAAVGYEPTVVTHPDKPTGVHYRVGDPSLMHRFHVPRVTLAEGIERAVRA
jgi:nucleoside-diphosphate-sugar epimerase